MSYPVAPNDSACLLGYELPRLIPSVIQSKAGCLFAALGVRTASLQSFFTPRLMWFRIDHGSSKNLGRPLHIVESRLPSRCVLPYFALEHEELGCRGVVSVTTRSPFRIFIACFLKCNSLRFQCQPAAYFLSLCVTSGPLGLSFVRCDHGFLYKTLLIGVQY